MTDTNKLAQYVANWQDERNSAALYRALSELEPNPQLKSVYHRLGEAEERHSCFWEAKLRAARHPLPPFRLTGAPSSCSPDAGARPSCCPTSSPSSSLIVTSMTGSPKPKPAVCRSKNTPMPVSCRPSPVGRAQDWKAVALRNSKAATAPSGGLR